MSSDTWLLIGKITGVHGLAGNLKIWSYAESPETYAPGRSIRLQDENEQGGRVYTIGKASPRKKGVLLQLKEVTCREQAEALVGKEILMDKSQLPELAEDTWYWEDLYGLEVIDQKMGNLGTIDRIFPTGADDILVVTPKSAPGQAEVMIPMNEHFVLQVDLEAKKMITCLPQGYVLD
jgi:16S rRNA processing protein RimM